uniref:Putative methyltransferase n=1 Tax=viral metagenome TaxID=1070528 RepID=A0A6M3LDT6_9ZZZZ
MILVICGAGKFNTIKRYKETYTFQKIYAFEPNVSVVPKVIDDDIVFINKAVSTENGYARLYTSTNYQSASLEPNKTTGGLACDKYEIVETIDFPAWLNETFSLSNILLDMDIEGTEYKVLDAMIENGSINLIEILTVECHWNKLLNMTIENHKELLNKIKSAGFVFDCNGEGNTISASKDLVA